MLLRPHRFVPAAARRIPANRRFLQSHRFSTTRVCRGSGRPLHIGPPRFPVRSLPLIAYSGDPATNPTTGDRARDDEQRGSTIKLDGSRPYSCVGHPRDCRSPAQSSRGQLPNANAHSSPHTPLSLTMLPPGLVRQADWLSFSDQRPPGPMPTTCETVGVVLALRVQMALDQSFWRYWAPHQSRDCVTFT